MRHRLRTYDVVHTVLFASVHRTGSLDGHVSYKKLNSGSIHHQSALVRNCTPCHLAISSFRTSFTNLCCLMMLSPLNFSLSISSAYMDPQPPLISFTYYAKKLAKFKGLPIVSSIGPCDAVNWTVHCSVCRRCRDRSRVVRDLHAALRHMHQE